MACNPMSLIWSLSRWISILLVILSSINWNNRSQSPEHRKVSRSLDSMSRESAFWNIVHCRAPTSKWTSGLIGTERRAMKLLRAALLLHSARDGVDSVLRSGATAGKRVNRGFDHRSWENETPKPDTRSGDQIWSRWFHRLVTMASKWKIPNSNSTNPNPQFIFH